MSSRLRFVICAVVSYITFQSAIADVEQRQFDTPQQAADALIQVAATFDPAAAKEILGPDSEDIVSSEDSIADKNQAQACAAKAKEKLSIQVNKKDPNQAIITVGNDGLSAAHPAGETKR